MAETHSGRHWLPLLSVKLVRQIKVSEPPYEWRHRAAAWLGCPHSKLLAVGALGRREGPAAPEMDLRRGRSGLLFAKPL